MLYIFDKIKKIAAHLDNYKQEEKVHDYRLILKLNMNLRVYVISNILSEKEIESFISSEGVISEIDVISKDDFESDDYYSSLFDSTEVIDLGLRRSLTNIIEYDDDISIDTCPIVSFYSYKGGVGRTTTLALFASYFALHHGKKVFIIDCDFEAPGLINFYGISNEETPKNGIVEYIKDKEASLKVNLRDNYTYEISSQYAGDGEIILLPAGNIFSDSDRNDYLEALSRLDIHGSSVIIEQFKDVILDINSQFSPDVILIDSRTGFNDIFGIIANKISNIVVGFFGNNTQNKPGLNFFLGNLLKKTRNVDIIIVLSIISSSFNRELKSFQNIIDEYIQTSLDDELESLPALPAYYLSRYSSLEKIGTPNEDLEDFISIIERKMYSDYQDLFDAIKDRIFSIGVNKCQSISSSTSTPNSLQNDNVKTNSDNDAKPSEKESTQEFSRECTNGKAEDKDSDQAILFKFKSNILNKLELNFPNRYADHIDFTDQFLSSEFYLRTYMEDIFNQEKFLLIGGKGTGKTAFYQALRQNSFFDKLKNKSQKKHLDYQVINIISLQHETTSTRKFIDVAARFPQSEIRDPEFFFRRFWSVYIWNSIRLEDEVTGFHSKCSIKVEPIVDDDRTAKRLSTIIEGDDFTEIENDLYEFDDYLKKNDKHIMIIFDQLDYVIKPKLWSKALAPLIRQCQVNNFNRIFPKLFLRRDLFNKLGNLTNKEALYSRTINLEWTKDELYAFFFKVIFAHSEDDFFEYTRRQHLISDEKLNDIKKKLHRKNSYNQLPPDAYLLIPLVESFFGKYAAASGKRYGEMYNWLYTNLKNADNTISLRPFLDLILYAIQKQKAVPQLNNDSCPILSSTCFNAEVREKAVERHFNDLADEEGNEPLRCILVDLREDRVPKKYKVSTLFQKEFEELLNIVIDQHDILKEYSLIELEELLKLNGIIFVRHVAGGRKKYSFAYLYKYYLGLRGASKKKY